MKKQELISVSPEAAALIVRYNYVSADNNELYVNPDGKRARLHKAAEDLTARIINVSQCNPDFDEVARMANDIAEQCGIPDATPKYPQTKEQIYEEIVEKLCPMLQAELIGKNLLFKDGPYKFSYFKADRLKVRNGMHSTLEIVIAGPGFSIDYSPDNQLLIRHRFPMFKDIAVDAATLLVTGKNEPFKQWLYVISDKEYLTQFNSAVSGIAKTIGVTGDTGKENT